MKDKYIEYTWSKATAVYLASSAFFCVGRNRSTWRKPTQTRGKHAPSTQRGSARTRIQNPEPSARTGIRTQNHPPGSGFEPRTIHARTGIRTQNHLPRTGFKPRTTLQGRDSNPEPFTQDRNSNTEPSARGWDSNTEPSARDGIRTQNHPPRPGFEHRTIRPGPGFESRTTFL